MPHLFTRHPAVARVVAGIAVCILPLTGCSTSSDSAGSADPVTAKSSAAAGTSSKAAQKSTPNSPAVTSGKATTSPRPSGTSPRPSGTVPRPSGTALRPSGTAPRPSGTTPTARSATPSSKPVSTTIKSTVAPRPSTSSVATATRSEFDNGLPAAPCSLQVDAALVDGSEAVKGIDPGVAVGIVMVRRDAPHCTASNNGTEPFPTASVVKLLIAIDVLGSGKTGTETRDRVVRMLSLSDDDIANDLWVHYGGSGIVTRTKSLINLPSLSPPDNPQYWGSTRIDALDVARIWRYILDDAPEAVRAPILTGTGGAKERAADGFDQYFGIPNGLPKSSWWIKQGWGTSHGRRVVNTTGLIGRNKDSILVMLTSHPLDVGYPAATDSVTRGVNAMAAAVGES